MIRLGDGGAAGLDGDGGPGAWQTGGARRAQRAGKAPVAREPDGLAQGAFMLGRPMRPGRARLFDNTIRARSQRSAIAVGHLTYTTRRPDLSLAPYDWSLALCVVLNDAGVAGVNAALGGMFVLGGDSDLSQAGRGQLWVNTAGGQPRSDARLLADPAPTTPPAPIPLPAAGWLLLSGLGALAVARRRT